jgi:primosomal protein N' (replication factor Y)
VLAEVPGGPAIVVATPGAEPTAPGGYAAALLLDTASLLLRPDLRADEEALRRWLNVVALVRPGPDGGSVLAVGDSGSRALQALVRLDPPGFAARELGDRADAGFPPEVKLVTIEGEPAALEEVVDLIDLPPGAHLLGPVDLPPVAGSASGTAETRSPPGADPGLPAAAEWRQRLIVRSRSQPSRAEAAALVRAVRDVLGVRSARKSTGALRVRVDPVAIG